MLPDSWSEPYRFVIKRTPIIDKDDKQLYLDDGMRKYAYWIVVTNSTRSNTAVPSRRGEAPPESDQGRSAGCAGSGG